MGRFVAAGSRGSCGSCLISAPRHLKRLYAEGPNDTLHAHISERWCDWLPCYRVEKCRSKPTSFSLISSLNPNHCIFHTEQLISCLGATRKLWNISALCYFASSQAGKTEVILSIISLHKNTPSYWESHFKRNEMFICSKVQALLHFFALYISGVPETLSCITSKSRIFIFSLWFDDRNTKGEWTSRHFLKK